MSFERYDECLKAIDHYTSYRLAGEVRLDVLWPRRKIERELADEPNLLRIAKEIHDAVDSIEQCLKNGDRTGALDKLQYLMGDSHDAFKAVIDHECPDEKSHIRAQPAKKFTSPKEEKAPAQFQLGLETLLRQKVQADSIDIPDEIFQEILTIARDAVWLNPWTKKLMCPSNIIHILALCLEQPEQMIDIKTFLTSKFKSSTLKKGIQMLKTYMLKNSGWELKGSLSQGIILQRCTSSLKDSPVSQECSSQVCILVEGLSLPLPTIYAVAINKDPLFLMNISGRSSVG